jgi:hypothetical protein
MLLHHTLDQKQKQKQNERITEEKRQERTDEENELKHITANSYGSFSNRLLFSLDNYVSNLYLNYNL